MSMFATLEEENDINNFEEAVRKHWEIKNIFKLLKP